MAGKPVLYAYFRSSCSYRVRIALAHKGIEYDVKPVNLIKEGGEQHTEEYKSINPAELVPSLSIDGQMLTESMAILEYLEETRPEKPLLPKDPVKRAKCRALAYQIACGTQPVANLKVAKYVGEEKKLEWLKHWNAEGLRIFEKLLANTAGTYCFGDEVTIADVCLMPQVYNAQRFKVDFSVLPRIEKIRKNLEILPAFKAAHPHAQLDCPEDLKGKP